MDLTNSQNTDTLEVSKTMELSHKVVTQLSKLQGKGALGTLTHASQDELMALSAYLGAALVEKNPQLLEEYLEMIQVCRLMYRGLLEDSEAQGVSFDPSTILVPVVPESNPEQIQ